jgi:hypothetical protein
MPSPPRSNQAIGWNRSIFHGKFLPLPYPPSRQDTSLAEGKLDQVNTIAVLITLIPSSKSGPSGSPFQCVWTEPFKYLLSPLSPTHGTPLGLLHILFYLVKVALWTRKSRIKCYFNCRTVLVSSSVVGLINRPRFFPPFPWMQTHWNNPVGIQIQGPI